MNFVNPLFLMGVTALAVPVLLHLIKRERAEKVEFPTLMYLRRISRKTIRYQKLRHLLLLLLRMLALGCLVLAFMRPFRSIAPSAAAAPGRITQGLIILVDNSMSMGYGDRLARAREAAGEIVRRAEPGDKVAVLEFSDRSVARFQLSSDFAGAANRISRLELTDHPTRFAQALKAAEQVALNAATGRRIIWIVSDFQKNAWSGEEQDFRLSPGIELQYVDVGSDDFSNLAFGEVQVVEPEQNAGGELKVKASVVNYGAADRNTVRVALTLDGRLIGEQRIDIPKGGSQGVEFPLPRMMPGTRPLVLELDDTHLKRDDRFEMMVEARDRTRVLAVDGAPSAGAQPPSYFLAKALNISALSHYVLTTTSVQGFENAPAAAPRVLIWNAVAAPGAGALKKIRSFVENGGGLVLVLDDPARASEFNRSFGAWLPVKAVEEASRGGRSRSMDDYVLLTSVRTDHPIFRPFSEPHSGTFATARFFSHVKLTVDPKCDVLARFDNGDPALVFASVDKGRVLLFASSADDRSNDLPLKAVYPPLWQQMLRYLENYQEGKRWFHVGDAVSPREILVDAGLKQAKADINLNQPIVVLDPSKRRVETAPGASAVALDQAGLYEIKTADFSATLAVNTIARESDLAHGNAEEMAAGWAARETKSIPAAADAENLTPEQQDSRQRLWVFVLIAAAVLLLSETLVGNYSAVRSGN